MSGQYHRETHCQHQAPHIVKPEPASMLKRLLQIPTIQTMPTGEVCGICKVRRATNWAHLQFMREKPRIVFYCDNVGCLSDISDAILNTPSVSAVAGIGL